MKRFYFLFSLLVSVACFAEFNETLFEQVKTLSLSNPQEACKLVNQVEDELELVEKQAHPEVVYYQTMLSVSLDPEFDISVAVDNLQFVFDHAADGSNLKIGSSFYLAFTQIIKAYGQEDYPVYFNEVIEAILREYVPGSEEKFQALREVLFKELNENSAKKEAFIHFATAVSPKPAIALGDVECNVTLEEELVEGHLAVHYQAKDCEYKQLI